MKEEAITLRQEGHTYKEIAEALSVSVDWCKKNLKDVSKGLKNEPYIDEIITLATRPEGITVYEANGIIMKHHTDKQLSQSEMSNIRAKAKRKNKDCLFRPEWISVENPSSSYKSLCAYVLHLQDEIDNVVRWYCDEHQNISPDSVRAEIIEYIKPTKTPLPIRVARAETMIEILSDRNQSAPNKTSD